MLPAYAPDVVARREPLPSGEDGGSARQGRRGEGDWSLQSSGASPWMLGPRITLHHSSTISLIWRCPIPTPTCTQRNAMLMQDCPDRAIRVADQVHDLPDREPIFVEPHGALDIFRGDALFPQRHTLTLE